MTAARAPLCLVFDLDDTLYPERAYERSGLAAAGRWGEQNLGLMGLERILLDRIDGDLEGPHFQCALSEHFRDRLGENLKSGADRLAAELREAYHAHEPTGLQLHDDARWALDHFRNLPLGLVTDGYPHVQSAKIAALGIAGRFRHIVVTDELGGVRFRKPCQSGFKSIEFAMPNARAFVYVADNVGKDFVAPNRRGWVTIQIVRPDGVHAAVAPRRLDGRPDYTIASLHDLPNVLGVACDPDQLS